MNTEMKVCVKKGDEWIAEALVSYLNDKIHDFICTGKYIIANENLTIAEKKRDILRASMRYNDEIHEVIGFSFVFLEMFQPDSYSDMFDNVTDVIAEFRDEFYKKIDKEYN